MAEERIFKIGNKYGRLTVLKLDHIKEYISPKETKYNHGFRKDLYFWLDREEGLEVIGNIHENPELLEGK